MIKETNSVCTSIQTNVLIIKNKSISFSETAYCVLDICDFVLLKWNVLRADVHDYAQLPVFSFDRCLQISMFNKGEMRVSLLQHPASSDTPETEAGFDPNLCKTSRTTLHMNRQISSDENDWHLMRWFRDEKTCRMWSGGVRQSAAINSVKGKVLAMLAKLLWMVCIHSSNQGTRETTNLWKFWVITFCHE